MEKTPQTINLPSWLSAGNFISLLTMLGGGIGIWVGVTSAQAVQGEKIMQQKADLEQVRKDTKDALRDIREDQRQISQDVRELRDRVVSNGKRGI